MTSASESSDSPGMSNTSKYLACQKSPDVKFTISTLRKNVASVSNSNILRTENNGSDDEEGTVNGSKRRRLAVIKNGQIVEYVNYHSSNFWHRRILLL